MHNVINDSERLERSITGQARPPASGELQHAMIALITVGGMLPRLPRCVPCQSLEAE